jgi:hypothetical protein
MSRIPLPAFSTYRARNIGSARSGLRGMEACIDDGFGDRLPRDLVSQRRLVAFGPCADHRRELGENEVHCPVDELEHGAFEDLVGQDRFTHLFAVEVHALDLGAGEEALRFRAEKQHGRMAGLRAVEEVEVCKRRGHRRTGPEGISTLRLGAR